LTLAIPTHAVCPQLSPIRSANPECRACVRCLCDAPAGHRRPPDVPGCSLSPLPGAGSPTSPRWKPPSPRSPHSGWCPRLTAPECRLDVDFPTSPPLQLPRRPSQVLKRSTPVMHVTRPLLRLSGRCNSGSGAAASARPLVARRGRRVDTHAYPRHQGAASGHVVGAGSRSPLGSDAPSMRVFQWRYCLSMVDFSLAALVLCL
jgi:hypothetical protein